MIGSVTLAPVSPAAPVREGQATGSVSALASGEGLVTISRSGDLLSRFQQLVESDPSRVQAALDRVSRDLGASAARASGSQADLLRDLAGRFARAASAGDLSALVLSAASHHRHGVPAVRVPGLAGGGTPTVTGGPAPADPAAQATLDSVLAQVDHALGMNPPPLGPWFTL
jgi:hypothetical protein